MKTPWLQGGGSQTDTLAGEIVEFADGLSSFRISAHRDFIQNMKNSFIFCINARQNVRIQVLSTDITCTARGDHRSFVIGIVDGFRRKVHACKAGNTMDAFLSVEMLKTDMDSCRNPAIFNSDQGWLFASAGTQGPWHSDRHGRARTLFGFWKDGAFQTGF